MNLATWADAPTRSLTAPWRGRRLQQLLWGAGTVVVLIALWFVATTVLGLVSPLALPAPQTVLARFVTLSSSDYVGETLWGHAAASVRIVGIGWALAGLIGVPLGVAMSWSRRARNLTYPVFQVLRSIPPIAWIPLAILWFGIDSSARVFIVVIAAVVPWTINSAEAVRGVDPLLVRAAVNLGAGRRMLTSVVLPAGLPTLLAGARIALGNAWTALVAAELLAATSGLGFVALNASRALDTPTMLAAMFVIGALGILFSFVLLGVARLVAPWSRGSDG